MQVCDVHCHFFSSRFLEILAKDRRDIAPGDHAAVISTLLGWEPPGPPGALADRWVAELDRHHLARAAVIASIPGDEESVATAQTAYAPTGTMISHPGRWYWRVRADYCDNIKGQWAPVRSFHSVRPPDFGLNTIPTKIGFAEGLVVTGALSYNGAKVKQPTLVLWGASDRIATPDYGRRYAALIPGARFEIIGEAGHHPELEQPRAFVDQVARFLRQSA